ncbi:hypothetical protein H3N56_02555 [Cetobacterium sp. 2A]|uniref:hypothetical protein n=1 Tax=Cetobacterium sp. 2A TaxID=2754723 RepID=UPI00163D310C|nr:hypothetical protein [Cetobacterium sp. 2A]MBC2855374.1 hypothetical protein [Cetobacterium sp. 2A]
MKSKYYIGEDNLAEMTGLSPRSIRNKFKNFKIKEKEYDYLAIAEDAIEEKYSLKKKQIFVDVETFSRILGVTEKTIQNYKTKKILLAEIDGTFDLLMNLEKYNQESNEYNKILRVKREREEVRKERELLLLDIEERKYIPVDLYGSILRDLSTTFKQELLRTATTITVNLKNQPHTKWKKNIQEILDGTLVNLNKLSEEIGEKVIEIYKKEEEANTQ